MIRLQQLKLPILVSPKEQEEALIRKIKKQLGFTNQQSFDYKIRKRSIDARKKPELYYVYTVDVSWDGEEAYIRKQQKKNSKNPTFQMPKDESYQYPNSGSKPMNHPPVIVGAGPAGLFCAYALAKCGYRPIVVERGKSVEERTKDVQTFWETGILKPNSNVQFGEGGAGTFSDGKLNTLVKDPFYRGKKVLEIFVEHGAPAEILYDNKPHIGTDLLVSVIANIRKEIIRLGGRVLFEHQLVGMELEDNRIQSICLEKRVKNSNTIEKIHIQAEQVVLALGHSARDTFAMLKDMQFLMEPKSFAVGFRVEHPQSMIQMTQYGDSALAKALPSAPYKVTANFERRGVYSFCMCPGGYVVNASSEEKRLAVNGMSYYDRDSANANSAIIVSVNPNDFGGDCNDPLSGIQFQRKLEEKAYSLGNGKIPQQLYGDYKSKVVSNNYGTFSSCTKGGAAFAPLHELFTEEMSECFIEGMETFERYIKGFARADAILSGVESRTSSPIRIIRDENLESNRKGIYPCGEGAGYAGGITSAAMDGLKVAEQIIKTYQPPRS